MQTESYAGPINGTMEQASLADRVKRVEETCNKCSPLSTVTCIEGCSIWKMKNEFRDLHHKMNDADFIIRLLNALKNRKRLHVLGIVSKNHTTISRLQNELKKQKHYHSQRTIVEEYIGPLINVGLAAQDEGKYFATMLGRRLIELTKRCPDFVEILPPHSEGYEETLLADLLKETMTHENLEKLIPSATVARVLGRLQAAGLITTTKENDHIFFFKTQRDPNKESFSPTERRVYESILEEGISARRLARRMNISLRRTYKYLRRLKGKKMIFTREKPKSYALTEKGIEVATVLQRVQNSIREVFEVAAQILNDGKSTNLVASAYQSKS